MLKFFGFCLKVAIFSILVLILGNTLYWDGKTISDQVKLKMAHAERSNVIDTVRDWAKKVTLDAKLGLQRKPDHSVAPTHSSTHEQISSSERQKLKALIQELNHSQRED